MNFNHDTGTIQSLLAIDTTVASPINGATQSLVVVGTGALYLPLGTTAERPANSAGMLRYNTQNSVLEYNTGAAWSALSTGGGTVSSVAISGSTGLDVTGSPITSSGTITLTLDAGLQSLSALATTGLIVQSAADTFVSRTLTGTAGNISVTNGTGVAGDPTFDLVNAGTPVSNTFVKITTDAKGRVTATSAVATADITALVDGTYVNVAGDSMSSAANLTFSGGGEVLGLPTTPTTSGSAVSKAYVDSLVQGLDTKASVRAATTANGTLATAFQNGSTIDGVTLATGNRILIKNQSAPAENGIYIVNATGAPTRADDMSTWDEVPSSFVFVEEGTTQADTGWTATANAGGTLGVTSIPFTQFSGAGTYSAGTGLTLTGTQFSLTTPVTAANGGTGTTATPTNGQLLIGNGTNYTLAALTQGTGITVTNGAGSITIANAGVTSIAGTANQITASASTGAVTLSLPSAVTLPGSLTVTTNLIVQGLTANSFLYSNGSDQLTSTAAPTNGQLLIGSTGAAPVAATLTQGTGIQITNSAGGITIASTVTGTVTSVALSAPAIFNVSGSPVTTSGTLTLALATQANNVVFAGPSTGGPLAPTFRQLTFADLSATAIKLYAENPSTPVAPTASGTNAVALGSGAAAGGVTSLAVGTGASAGQYGQKAYASGSFATAGDAQSSKYVLRNITTDATVTELFLDGSSSRIVVPNNGAMAFNIVVVARRTDSTGGGAGYRVEGVIRKDTTSGSVTMIGSPAKSILGETNVAWDVTVDADTTTGALRVRVTGEAAKTIRWVASVDTAEVTN